MYRGNLISCVADDVGGGRINAFLQPEPMGVWAPTFAPGEANLYGVDIVGGIIGGAVGAFALSVLATRKVRAAAEVLPIGGLLGFAAAAGIGVARSMARKKQEAV